MYKRIRKLKFIQFDNLNNLICYRCQIYKPVNEFDISTTKDNFRNKKARVCKKCRSKKYKDSASKSRGKMDFNRIITERFNSLKTRARNKKLVVEIDCNYLKELWTLQKGLCAISNLEMTYYFNNGRVPTNLSIDRIDSSKGYTKDNIQLVCMAINTMKSDLCLDQLIYFCNKIIKHNENKNN